MRIDRQKRAQAGGFARSGKRGAFTLIELLVVIAIIAILANLLLPSLRDARDRALEMHCKSNVHQWAVQLAMFHEDHAGYTEKSFEEGNLWPHSLRDYFTGDSILYCPKASKIKPNGYGNGPQHRGTTFYAWNAPGWWDNNPKHWAGSYGKNGWVAHASSGFWYGADPKENLWNNTIQIERADNVPLIMDSAWLHPLPLHSDSPPPFADDMTVSGFGQNIQMCAMDRHTRAINVAFFDGSAQRIGLKGLWTLQWHPLWNLENRWTSAGGVSSGDWPQWMHQMEDY